jgi:DNA modification methylase
MIPPFAGRIIEFSMLSAWVELDAYVVFDPFMGSGTTAVAALANERCFLGFETNRNYYETAISRIKTFLDHLNNITK